MTGWQLTVGELTWEESEVTADEAADICRLAGGGWEMFDPMHSPAAAAAAAAVLLASRGGRDLPTAVAEVAAMPAVELFACITRG